MQNSTLLENMYDALEPSGYQETTRPLATLWEWTPAKGKLLAQQ